MKSRALLLLLLTASIHLPACSTDHKPTSYQEPPPTEIIALIHGQLIDDTGTNPIPDATILIARQTITAAGPHETVLLPDGATIIDLTDTTILPGFINTHVHQGYNKPTLEAWAQGGVTTIRDLGANPQQPLFTIRDSLNTTPDCARLVAAGPMLTVPNGYPMVPWGSHSGLPVVSPADARTKTNQLLDDGADIIKIAVEAGSCFGRHIPTLTLPEIAAIVDVAHNRGIRVSAHVLMSVDLERALKGGADDIAHMVSDNLPDSLINRMVAEDIYWVPTLELWHNVGHGLGPIAIENLRRFVQAGGKVALGTDYAGYNSTFDLGMPIREIRWMREAGMTPMQIIVASTNHAAIVCNKSEKIGTVEPGKVADLIVVQGNPLEDLETLANVGMVFHNGVLIRGNRP
ncbi:amidohydrolase family protein [Candidatus Eisenbacteria bacterium]|uniref:Amidohydrolase family protein n=1 Tax=Eiseniibacteriota bacterium TaxID=2212470 RepID=A0ABV6YJK3_UNCEI